MLWLTKSTVRPLGNVAHFSEAFLLKLGVSDGQDFVHDQNFRLQMRGHRKGEANIHPTTVTFYRSIKEYLYTGKGNDLIELALNFQSAHPENRSVQEDVFAACQIRMEPGADFQQTGDPAGDGYAATARFRDATKNLEQGALPGAITSDDPDDITVVDFEGNVPKRPKFFARIAFLLIPVLSHLSGLRHTASSLCLRPSRVRF